MQVANCTAGQLSILPSVPVSLSAPAPVSVVVSGTPMKKAICPLRRDVVRQIAAQRVGVAGRSVLATDQRAVDLHVRLGPETDVRRADSHGICQGLRKRAGGGEQAPGKQQRDQGRGLHSLSPCHCWRPASMAVRLWGRTGAGLEEPVEVDLLERDAVRDHQHLLDGLGHRRRPGEIELVLSHALTQHARQPFMDKAEMARPVRRLGAEAVRDDRVIGDRVPCPRQILQEGLAAQATRGATAIEEVQLSRAEARSPEVR